MIKCSGEHADKKSKVDCWQERKVGIYQYYRETEMLINHGDKLSCETDNKRDEKNGSMTINRGR